MRLSKKSLSAVVILSFGFLFLREIAQGQTKCNCPPLKLYMYDTKIDFPMDKNADAVEAGKYVEAKNSGDWLKAAYDKQQSDEFQIYKGLRPGASKGTTYELPPPEGGSSEGGIDFTSYAQIVGSLHDGSFSYKVSIIIDEVYRHVTAIVMETTTNDLGQVDNLIDKMISENSPVINQLRAYQKNIRDVSLSASDETEYMWIGLKFKVIPEKTKLKVGETTKVHIKVFDCLDEKPVAGQELNLRVGSPEIGVINARNIKTNSSGEATFVFTAVSLGETMFLPPLQSLSTSALAHTPLVVEAASLLLVMKAKFIYLLPR